MIEKDVFNRLTGLYTETGGIDISKDHKFVILSDLHMGDGGRLDDFVHNSEFLSYVLENHYEPKQFHLVLNGDIEELHRFPLKKVLCRYKEFYKVLEKFQRRNTLTRLFGNHDYQLHKKKHFLFKTPIKEAFKIKWKGDDILIFHGHQAGRFTEFMNTAITVLLRTFGNSLGIKNYTVAFDSKKKYDYEKRVYDFAKTHKILAVIGHTHRPLFESLARTESLKFKIERLCRIYPLIKPEKKKRLEEKIKRYKDELQKLLHKEKGEGDTGNLYSMDLLVPCLFNSGCGIGKNGVTAIEISNGNIELVYWFDRKRTEKYFHFNGSLPRQLETGDYWRVTLKKETLDYIFSRVKLLS